MSLKEIIQHILGEAEREKTRILQEAEKEAQRIIQEAQAKADLAFREFIHQQEKEIERKQRKILSEVSLEAKKDLARLKEKLVLEVFIEIKELLKKKEIKKEVIYPERVVIEDQNPAVYLKEIYQEYLPQLAKILFG